MNKECPACETRHRDGEPCPTSRGAIAQEYSELEIKYLELKKELDFIKAARDKCQKTICEDCGSLLQRF